MNLLKGTVVWSFNTLKKNFFVNLYVLVTNSFSVLKRILWYPNMSSIDTIIIENSTLFALLKSWATYIQSIVRHTIHTYMLINHKHCFLDIYIWSAGIYNNTKQCNGRFIVSFWSTPLINFITYTVVSRRFVQTNNRSWVHWYWYHNPTSDWQLLQMINL